ncbi:malto-oligosyltrehalose synthase [Paracoccus sp. ME4]|uniref:malto-oligosyltrehalose synthase n=1 Tax=Paracoccus sp. ME4 TaxID=3138066 RepID=UPI00398B3430
MIPTIPTIPTATCRIQLRDGVDFAALTARLDQIAATGVSHLYLSPIFAATEGSTHGYDITDPTRIDPALGGRAGFDALAEAASARGLGIILDIVPNHTAFSVQNPWLASVLRDGRGSGHARHFDIDWQAGPLVLPWLEEPFETMLTDGAFRVADGHWHVGDLAIPLAPGSDASDDLRAVHEAQHWRLAHATRQRDGITHRRFFNVTDLIGMRVEDGTVFDDTHALILELVRLGRVQGLRVDHVDGLADPAGYLERLAEALPGTPVWVEKILTGDEPLRPSWRSVGTTGYEAGRLITRMLTPAEGLAALDHAWRQATGPAEPFAEALRAAKHDVLDNELAAERRQLARMAGIALAPVDAVDPGPEALREAVTALLVAMPRYRTYVTEAGADADDRALIATVADRAAADLRDDAVLRALAALWAQPENAAQLAFAVRFQQVSGALLAKAQEDTAGFRWTRFLPANEVGAEPDEATITAAGATRAMAARRPGDMVLTSSHDSKRSEDARARMIAAAHLPDDLAALDRAAAALPEAREIPPRWRWYMVQTALAMCDAPEAADRLAAHVEKAMREAKETSFWTRPDEDAEARLADLGRALLDGWQAARPDALTRLLWRGDALMLAQLLIKAVMPGFPDLYQGTQDRFLALTDPDNRRPVDWDAQATAAGRDDAGGVKARWTPILMRLRRERAGFLECADCTVRMDAGGLSLLRRADGRHLGVRLDLPGGSAGQPQGQAILHWTGPDGCRICLTEGQGPTRDD